MFGGIPIRDQLLKRCLKFYERLKEAKTLQFNCCFLMLHLQVPNMGFNMKHLAMESGSRSRLFDLNACT